jgi:hypothetical protein
MDIIGVNFMVERLAVGSEPGFRAADPAASLIHAHGQGIDGLPPWNRWASRQNRLRTPASPPNAMEWQEISF